MCVEMVGDQPTFSSKFGKSLSNRGTEKTGVELLLADRRFQLPDIATKREIVRLLPVQGEWGVQTFDLVMTDHPVAPLSAIDVKTHLDSLTLVEMKTTRKRVHDARLNGFFFGATEREYAMAKALGERYCFAFVVLNTDNAYGREFAVLLTVDQVESRTRQKRVQYQVNFRSDMEQEALTHRLILLGDVVSL
jgi:hypothetical protein